MVEDVTPRVKPLPFGPANGSFLTTLAAAALPLVPVPPGAGVDCAPAPPAPAHSAVSAMALPPQINLTQPFLTSIPPNRRTSRSEHPGSCERQFARGFATA